jgi:AcrR family transcriptional regulator
MEAIAGEAGVAVGTLYRHHPTKAALLRAVLADSATKLAEDTEAALEAVRGGKPPGEALRALVLTYSERYADDRAVKSAAAGLGEHVGDDPAGFAEGSPERRAVAALESLLAEAREAGQVRDDVGLADLVLLLNAVPGPEVEPEVRRRFVEIVVAGLRAPRA